ncbi:MAG: hypothetical protein C4345_10430, partial [Chloroflexota bacterium]
HARRQVGFQADDSLRPNDRAVLDTGWEVESVTGSEVDRSAGMEFKADGTSRDVEHLTVWMPVGRVDVTGSVCPAIGLEP